MDLPAGALVALAVYWISPYVCRVVIFCGEMQKWFGYQREG
jgi:hypothetical protein